MWMRGRTSSRTELLLHDTLALLAALAILAVAVSGQQRTSAPSVRIVSPEPGGYAVGPVIVRATIEPVTQPVERVEFWVDAVLVCLLDGPVHPPFECRWNAGPQVSQHTFRVVATLPGGRKLPESIQTRAIPGHIEKEYVDALHIAVSVHDGQRFVRGLTQEAFRLFEDGARRRIEHFEPVESSDLELVVAVDISQSMTESMPVVREVVKTFLAGLRPPPQDLVHLVAFNENPVLYRFVDRAQQLKAVDRLAPWGMTSLYETIVRSFGWVGKQPGRHGLVIFTDGDDTSSKIPREAVTRRAEQSDAVLYIIGQGEATKSIKLKQLCEQLARKSGGRAFFPIDDGQLRQSYDAIREELSNQYLIGFTPRDDNKTHTLRIEVGHYDVKARQEYRWTRK